MAFCFLFGGGTELKSTAFEGGTAQAVPPGLKPRKARIFRHTPYLTPAPPFFRKAGKKKRIIKSLCSKRSGRTSPPGEV